MILGIDLLSRHTIPYQTKPYHTDSGSMLPKTSSWPSVCQVGWSSLWWFSGLGSLPKTSTTWRAARNGISRRQVQPSSQRDTTFREDCPPLGTFTYRYMYMWMVKNSKNVWIFFWEALKNLYIFSINNPISVLFGWECCSRKRLGWTLSLERIVLSCFSHFSFFKVGLFRWKT